MKPNDLKHDVNMTFDFPATTNTHRIAQQSRARCQLVHNKEHATRSSFEFKLWMEERLFVVFIFSTKFAYQHW